MSTDIVETHPKRIRWPRVRAPAALLNSGWINWQVTDEPPKSTPYCALAVAPHRRVAVVFDIPVTDINCAKGAAVRASWGASRSRRAT